MLTEEDAGYASNAATDQDHKGKATNQKDTQVAVLINKQGWEEDKEESKSRIGGKSRIRGEQYMIKRRMRYQEKIKEEQQTKKANHFTGEQSDNTSLV